MKKDKLLQLWVEKSLYDEIQTNIASTHISMSEFIRMAIQSALVEDSDLRTMQERLKVIEERFQYQIATAHRS